ncbi:MAG TPA: hypothetical protein VGP92_13175 [Acidimicrobiia bacterium]|jgi:hypothetical protein|nr:hypothetical protein [Acidimicrobiia bacterium]
MVPLVFALVLVLVSACSSGKGKTGGNPVAGSTTSPGVSQGWTSGGVSAMKALALRVQHVAPGQCPDVLLLPHDAYLAAARRLHLDPPLAAVDCQVYGDTAELNVFASAAARDAYVDRRTAALCTVAKNAKAKLAALHWATGSDYAIQFAGEGAARRAASALSAIYRVVACPGQSDVVWDAAAELRVARLGAELAARPAIKCRGQQLLDRVQYAHDPRYKNRLPAAFAQCAGPAGTVIYIAAFNARTVQPAAFISGETKLLCGHGVAAVRGTDFAIIATNVKIAALAAVATGGTALPPAC